MQAWYNYSMPKATRNLSKYFKPAKYIIVKSDHGVQLTITGQKLAPPSHRINLHQSNLKVNNAKIIRLDKHGPIEIDIGRINHLPTFQEVRLHSKTIMYPGLYQIELEYKIKPEKLAELGQEKPSRELLPSIDDAEAWQSAEVVIKS